METKPKTRILARFDSISEMDWKSLDEVRNKNHVSCLDYTARPTIGISENRVKREQMSVWFVAMRYGFWMVKGEGE